MELLSEDLNKIDNDFRYEGYKTIPFIRVIMVKETEVRKKHYNIIMNFFHKNGFKFDTGKLKKRDVSIMDINIMQSPMFTVVAKSVWINGFTTAINEAEYFINSNELVKHISYFEKK